MCVSRYIFRHNRAIFWTVRDQIPEYIGNHWVVRWTMGWMFPPLVTFLKLPATPQIKHEMMNHRVYQALSNTRTVLQPNTTPQPRHLRTLSFLSAPSRKRSTRSASSRLDLPSPLLEPCVSIVNSPAYNMIVTIICRRISSSGSGPSWSTPPASTTMAQGSEAFPSHSRQRKRHPAPAP